MTLEQIIEKLKQEVEELAIAVKIEFKEVVDRVDKLISNKPEKQTQEKSKMVQTSRKSGLVVKNLYPNDDGIRGLIKWMRRKGVVK